MLHESPNFAEHASRLLDKFAASTVTVQYCSTALHFFKLLSSLGYLMETITVVQMADILLTSSLSRSSDPGACGGRTTIKALRWLSKIAMVEFLQTLIWSNYSDLTRPHPKWWFSKGNPLISVKSRLMKYYNLTRLMYHQVINAFVVAKHTGDQQETAPFSSNGAFYNATLLTGRWHF